ncbi:MAG: hypothetical protein U9P71_07020 [Campylobacterota bacterium]|nr:hypothetical protein [Campylobacterota bacterium]
MISVEYLLIIIALILLFLIYYIYSKDIQNTTQIRRVAMAVEELNKELYVLEKKFERHIQDTPIMENTMHDEDIAYELELGMKKMSEPMVASISEIHVKLQEQHDEFENKVQKLEESMRKFSLPSSVNGMDDSRIISLYQQGVDIVTISKELRLSKPEVEFVLKINKIK